ncbi:MAG TPA: hypothetical protein VF476_04530 [Chitinophagaceae bacterium]
MKSKLVKVSLLAAALLFTTANFAQQEGSHEKHEKVEPKFKKTKSYSKSYSLASSDKISLNNQFGEMKLVTWEKNEIKVDVTIIGKSDEEPRAQEIVDRISIADGKDGNTVYFKTKFADDKKTSKDDGKKHRNEGMEINYLVYLPSGNSLDAENQFGKMIIPDYRGEAQLESKFGSLTAGKISNAKSISVEFGKADVAHMNGGKLTIKFSSGTVNKLSGDVKSSLEYSKVKLDLDNDVKSLDINNSFSDVYLDVNTNFSASYNISTSHGEFSNKTSFAIKDEGSNDDNRYGPRFNKTYSGTSGSGAAKVKVSSSFGQTTVGHNLQVDMSQKKNKDKDKTKTTRSL